LIQLTHLARTAHIGNMKLRSVVTSLALGGLGVGMLGGTAVLIVSCTSSGPSYTSTAAVAGSDDTHCLLQDAGTPYLLVQPTSQSDCQFRPPIDAAPPIDAPGTVAPDAGTPESDFGATMFNSSGRDDDCKYFVNWESTTADENDNVFFQAKAQFNATTPTMPVTGANIYAEVYLSDTHPAPPTSQAATESPDGTYKVGPIQFDAPGMWTVRFHLFENCLDYADDSPHGHAAFYVDVK
jgi:hypothetical protein